MTYDDLIGHYKTITEAANALSLSRQLVFNWKKRGVIPLIQQYRYQIVSNGELQANDPLMDDILQKRRE